MRNATEEVILIYNLP